MTGPPPFALVILPSGGAFDDSWERAIQPACKAAGAYAERFDAQLSPESGLQRMQNLIAKADLVIADMTQRHEDIFYAAGYAHALDKQVILLTGDEEDIPFDLKHYPHIVHGGSLPDRTELERRARHLLDAAARGDAPLATPVEISVNKVVLSPDVPRPKSQRPGKKRPVVRCRNSKSGWLAAESCASATRTDHAVSLFRGGRGPGDRNRQHPV